MIGHLQASALQTGGRAVSGFCEKSHSAEVCSQLKPLSVPERRGAIGQSGLCFKCLRPGHVARRCDVTCSECGGHQYDVLSETS